MGIMPALSIQILSYEIRVRCTADRGGSPCTPRLIYLRANPNEQRKRPLCQIRPRIKIIGHLRERNPAQIHPGLVIILSRAQFKMRGRAIGFRRRRGAASPLPPR